MNIEPTASPLSHSESRSDEPQPVWQALSSVQRRVIGVLIEKSKTTKDSYPLTLNAITTGCNQKSNRAPQMELAADDVELTLDELRDLGAVVEIQGTGRAIKYKHAMYAWLGVSKVELAVMGELLLRGEQTLGELRARAARMEPISGLDELKPLLSSLIDKRLVVELTPPGRGQLVTHGLYLENELEQIRQQSSFSTGSEKPAHTGSPSGASLDAPSGRGNSADTSPLKQQVLELQSEVRDLRTRLEQLERRMG